MRTTPEYMQERKIYQRDVSRVKRHLPDNWLKIITDRRPGLTKKRYQKLYNDLVNMINGRSYRAYLKIKKNTSRGNSLFNEIKELSTNNKKRHESEFI